MEKMTIEQAAANLQSLINNLQLKKAEYDFLFNSLLTLFNKAKENEQATE
jgi:nitrate reductase assembly molybdenum cofactor insertion protein NarJ